MCVALAALDAKVIVEGATGTKAIPLIELHRLPGDTPQIETVLEPGALITAITLPPEGFARRSSYRKVRDRASYAFALISVAAGLEFDGGVVKDVRLALGGVAHKPWRATTAEAALRGKSFTQEAIQAAAAAELEAAKGLRDNAFKIELAKRVIVDSLMKLVLAEETVR
jgi:xanthine dehydrogenase YagS FAD-binding subunit